MCTKRSDIDPKVTFHSFPNPYEAGSAAEYECKQWIKACGRDATILSLELVRSDFLPSKGKSKWQFRKKCSRKFFVCSEHFVDGKPTQPNPYPMPADRSTLSGD